MKIFSIIMSLTIFLICDLSAQCKPRKIIKKSSRGSYAAEGVTKISRIGYSSLPRKDQWERDIRKAKPGSKRYTLLVQERERIALDEIHKAQKYIVEYGSRKQKKYDKHVRTMKEELRILAPTLAKIQDFPFADRIDDIASVVKDIREGKIEMKDLKGRSYTKILSKIQDLQKKSLIDYQKQYMRDHF